MYLKLFDFSKIATSLKQVQRPMNYMQYKRKREQFLLLRKSIRQTRDA